MSTILILDDNASARETLVAMLETQDYQIELAEDGFHAGAFMIEVLIAEGHTTAEIGKMLCISAKTAEKHRVKLMKKLNVSDVAGLVRLAIKHRLVDVDG